jgi:hypothetical protein
MVRERRVERAPVLWTIEQARWLEAGEYVTDEVACLRGRKTVAFRARSGASGHEWSASVG